MNLSPIGPEGIAFGCDYNPEQWDEETQLDDIRLMVEAGVTMVSLGIFAWGAIEPEDGVFEFGWLHRTMDRLHAAGISVSLATPTACPPMWLHHAHPEMAMVDRAGTRLGQGSRQSWCPSSPVYSEYALRLVRRMAEAFGDHPALALWHVGNEMGCHNTLCYCETSSRAFQQWLRERYGSIDELNRAWGTAFWGQYYREFEHILAPTVTTTFQNPTHQLDFARFSSDQQVRLFDAERDLLKSVAPHVPVTTNFMVMEHMRKLDYARWAGHVDIIANDHYLVAEDAEPWRELAFCADRTRGLSKNEPWLLMEHSTSAVNWQHRNIAKAPGEMRRNTLAHIARGADGAMFFQWRASAFGAEKFHSALVPHAGTDTRVWREVVELGTAVGRLAEVRGTRADEARVAIMFDYEAWWASELDAHPTVDFSYTREVRAIHSELLDRGIAADVVPPGADLTGYSAIVIAGLYLMGHDLAERIAAAVDGGAHLLVTYFSGIVDTDDHVWMGGYPGALRELLGVRVEEFAPLREGDSVRLGTGDGESALTGSIWTERLSTTTATTIASYLDAPLAGSPAITLREPSTESGGTAWYLSAHLTDDSLSWLVDEFCDRAQLAPVARVTGGQVEVVRRRGGGRSYLFAINHAPEAARVEGAGLDLLTDEEFDGEITVEPGGVRIIREVQA